jgi:Flp pilus assembly protein TadB
MLVVLASFVVLGIIVGVMFWQYFTRELRASRSNLELKTEETDRMARLAHHLEVNTRQPSPRT